MINHKEIKQGSIEWHELRWGKIGGTLSSGLFVKSDTLLIDILSQRMEDFEPTDSFQNDAMQRGSDLEPFARQYLKDYTGYEFLESGWLQSKVNELLGISPDGITEDEKIGCEIKCFSRKKHYETLLNNEIPLDHINQIVHFFTVNPKLEKLFFIAFRPEAPKHFIKEVTLESIVNIGTKAKPILQTVSETRSNILELADTLLQQIKIKEQQLKF